MYKGQIYPCQTKLQTIDVSGAGDTFLAAFAYEFMNLIDVKSDIDEIVSSSINFANSQAQKVVSQRGVCVI